MTYALPSVAIIQHKRGDIVDFYEWFWGPELAGSSPPPSLQILMDADILFWKKVARWVEHDPVRGENGPEWGNVAPMVGRFPRSKSRLG